MKKLPFRGAFVATCLAIAFAHAALAATVEFHLLPDGPGNFKVTAKVSGDDNGGLSGYGFDLLGDVTALQHVTPRLQEAQKNGAAGPAGFTLARSADNVSYVLGSQNIADATFIPIYHLGTAAGSLAAEGITPLSHASVTQWDGELLLATGSYAGSFDSLSFWQDGPNSGANVFVDTSGPQVRRPETVSFYRDRAPLPTYLPPIHEPVVVPSPVDPTPLAPPMPPTLGPPFGSMEPTPAQAGATTVEYRLLPDGPGNFKVTAKVTGGGSGGLSGYGFDLLGDVTTLQHVAPGIVEGQKNGSIGPAGFTLARSADNVSYVVGSQNIADAAVLPIYGMGIDPGSLAAEGITPLGASATTQWEGELVLATGTYTGDFDSLSFLQSGPNTGANVFVDTSGVQVRLPEQISFFRNEELLPYQPPAIADPPTVIPPPLVVLPSPPIVDPVVVIPPSADPADPGLPEPPAPREPGEWPVGIPDYGWFFPWRGYVDSSVVHLGDPRLDDLPTHNGVPFILAYDGVSFDAAGTPNSLTFVPQAITGMNYGSSQVLINALNNPVVVRLAASGQQLADGDGRIPEPSSLALALLSLTAFRAARRLTR